MQKFDSELAMRVELAVTNEREKWEEQSRRAWQEQEQRLLATAHQEWSKAQESVLKAEVERTRREWERQADKTTQVHIIYVIMLLHYNSERFSLKLSLVYCMNILFFINMVRQSYLVCDH